jgi:hypothetical protein
LTAEFGEDRRAFPAIGLIRPSRKVLTAVDDLERPLSRAIVEAS